MTTTLAGYDYDSLEPAVGLLARQSADKIRAAVHFSLQHLIDVGRELVAVKEALPHGQWLPWLAAEFRWAERTARNFMAVAERFGKSATVADLPVEPTAAYLLAASSTPEEARRAALDRAALGEVITGPVARQIIAAHRPPPSPVPRPVVVVRQQDPNPGFSWERFHEQTAGIQETLEQALLAYQHHDGNELAYLGDQFRQWVSHFAAWTEGARLSMPANLQTDEFRLLWEAWQQHRKEKGSKSKLTPTALRIALQRLSKWGLERAVAALEYSIGSGWDGIFEPPAQVPPRAQGGYPNKPTFDENFAAALAAQEGP